MYSVSPTNRNHLPNLILCSTATYSQDKGHGYHYVNKQISALYIWLLLHQLNCRSAYFCHSTSVKLLQINISASASSTEPKLIFSYMIILLVTYFFLDVTDTPTNIAVNRRPSPEDIVLIFHALHLSCQTNNQTHTVSGRSTYYWYWSGYQHQQWARYLILLFYSFLWNFIIQWQSGRS